MLYDAYYEELEQYANNQKQSTKETSYSDLFNERQEEDDDEEEEEDEYEDDEEEYDDVGNKRLSFGDSLTVKGR